MELHTQETHLLQIAVKDGSMSIFLLCAPVSAVHSSSKWSSVLSLWPHMHGQWASCPKLYAFIMALDTLLPEHGFSSILASVCLCLREKETDGPQRKRPEKVLQVWETSTNPQR